MTQRPARHPRNPEQPLDITRGDGRLLSNGLTPYASLSGDAMDADTSGPESSVEAATARLASLIERYGNARRTVQNDKTLSSIGRRERVAMLAQEAAKNAANIVRPAAEALASRITHSLERFGASGEPLSGAEVSRILGNGRANAAGSLPFALNAGAMNRAADQLVRLANANESDRLHSILTDAADAGEPLVLSALDHGLAPFQRAEVMRVALIDSEEDAKLHRRFRAARNPEAAAEAAALIELARHLIGNGRGATQHSARAADSTPGGNEGHVEGATERLLRVLTSAGEDVAAVPPTLDSN